MRNSRDVFPLAMTARRAARIVPLLAAVAVGLAGLSSARSADAQTVVSTDFEDGTLQGWIPRGARRAHQHHRAGVRRHAQPEDHGPHPGSGAQLPLTGQLTKGRPTG